MKVKRPKWKGRHICLFGDQVGLDQDVKQKSFVKNVKIVSQSTSGISYTLEIAQSFMGMPSPSLSLTQFGN